MDLDTGAGLLHRLTSYLPNREWDVPVDDPRVRHDLVPNDPETLPPPMKGYPDGLPVLHLPRDLPDPGVAATAVLAGVAAPARPLDAAQLGRMLFLGAGVVRTAERDGRPILFRAAGSAGARFPLEVYASTRGVEGVPDGVHWFDPRSTRSSRSPGRRGSGHDARRDRRTVANGMALCRARVAAPLLGWRDVACQLSAAAASAGVASRLRSLFPDAAVRELVGADGVHEYPLALLSFGDGRTGDRSRRAGGPRGSFRRSSCRSALPHSVRASGTSSGRPGRKRPRCRISRRPTRSMRSCVVVARSGAWTGPGRCRGRCWSGRWRAAARRRVPHWVVVHGVDGVAAGVYRWPDLYTPLRAGDLRDELLRICLDQSLAADAAYVVIAATSLSRWTTAATATPSSRRGWSRAGSTWRRTPWVPAPPG